MFYLSEQAKLLGADALILKGERTEKSGSVPEASAAFNTVYNFENKKLYAIAIKYKSTINIPPAPIQQAPKRPAPGKSTRFNATSKIMGKVVAVSDGDIIKIMVSGGPVKVRLAEIDCPGRTQAYGKIAKEFTTDMVFGKVVAVRVKEVDRFGTTVGEVILDDGRSLNRELVGVGLAWWDRNHSEDTSLWILEKKAREQKLGLWRDSDPVPPWSLSHR